MMDILTEIVQRRKASTAKAAESLPLEQMKEKCRSRTDFRAFSRAMDEMGIRIIAEIKQASPSRGLLIDSLDAAKIASEYETAGAAAISVLTEPDYFLGSIDNLRKARSAATLPILQKDFIISEYQIYEGALAGADAVLLIVRLLTVRELERFYSLSLELGIVPVIEIHDVTELSRIKNFPENALIGINNRNLKTFKTDLFHASRLIDDVLEQGKRPIVLSGISNRTDLDFYLNRTKRFLVGEALIKASDRVSALRKLEI